MNLPFKQKNVNDLLQEEFDRVLIPKPLHKVLNDIKDQTGISLQRLYTEAMIYAIPFMMRKYEIKKQKEQVAA